MWCARGVTWASGNSRRALHSSVMPTRCPSNGGASSSTRTPPARWTIPMKQILQRKYGMTEEQADQANRRMTDLAANLGLEYHLDRVQAGNTFDAHRLIHLAAEARSGRRHEGEAAGRLLHRGPPGGRSRPPWPNWRRRWAWTPTRWRPPFTVTATRPKYVVTKPGFVVGRHRGPLLRHRRDLRGVGCSGYRGHPPAWSGPGTRPIR